VFAKLYTKGHVRADRWYKLWRPSCTAPGDEHPFRPCGAWSIRGLCLRLLQDIGSARQPYGIVEINAEREYMLVTEFHTGRRNRRADVDDTVIDRDCAVRSCGTPGSPTATSNQAT